MCPHTLGALSLPAVPRCASLGLREMCTDASSSLSWAAMQVNKLVIVCWGRTSRAQMKKPVDYWSSSQANNAPRPGFQPRDEFWVNLSRIDLLETSPPTSIIRLGFNCVRVRVRSLISIREMMKMVFRNEWLINRTELKLSCTAFETWEHLCSLLVRWMTYRCSTPPCGSDTSPWSAWPPLVFVLMSGESLWLLSRHLQLNNSAQCVFKPHFFVKHPCCLLFDYSE